jgi:hypothetical protein
MTDLVSQLSIHFTRTPPSPLNPPPPATPFLLKELWREGNEWHLLESGHHNVFGFNIFSIETVITLTADIFGDEEERQAWAARETAKGKSHSCAELTWFAFASFSEFDYLFICSDPESDCYGKVRHIVNNCCEEYELPSLQIVLEVLLLACEDRKELSINSKSYQISSNHEEGLCSSLKRLRKAVLDAH